MGRINQKTATAFNIVNKLMDVYIVRTNKLYNENSNLILELGIMKLHGGIRTRNIILYISNALQNEF